MLKITKAQLILLYVVCCIFVMILAFRFVVSPLIQENSELSLTKGTLISERDEISNYPAEIKRTETMLDEEEEKMQSDIMKLCPLMESGDDILNYILDYTNQFDFSPGSISIADTSCLLNEEIVDVPSVFSTEISLTVHGSRESCLALIDSITKNSGMLLESYSITKALREVPAGDGFTTVSGYSMELKFTLYMYG